MFSHGFAQAQRPSYAWLMRKSDQTKNIPQDRLLQGRPVALHVLDYGTFRVHDDGRTIGLYGFLITTDAGERVLVDTGMPAAYGDDQV